MKPIVALLNAVVIIAGFLILVLTEHYIAAAALLLLGPRVSFTESKPTEHEKQQDNHAEDLHPSQR